ncbi:hypothetical protein BJ944DRAFT_261672 [Cunninghamella echinulata]|nr:hypothetical protein BJ944DRAFT_261672 [Cunninghamella echinulata]
MSDGEGTLGLIGGGCCLIFLVVAGAIQLAFSVPFLNASLPAVCDVPNLSASVITKLFVATGSILVGCGALVLCMGAGIGLWLGFGNTFAFAVAIVGTVWYATLDPACAQELPLLTNRYLGIIILNYIYSVGLPVLVTVLVVVGGVSLASLALFFDRKN